MSKPGWVDDCVVAFPGMSSCICDRVVEEGSLLEKGPGKLFDNATSTLYVNPSVRCVDVGWFTGGWVRDMMWYLMERANAGWRYAIESMDDVQYATYRQHDFFEWHSDFRLVRAPEQIRKMTVTVQLSDPGDYVGGDLEFMMNGESYRPLEFRERGTVVAFASMLTHRVTPIKSGTRRSCTTWFKGPPFR